MHLTSDQLVDLAEGTRPESSAPHLAECADCRRQVGEMRAMMSTAAGVEVPEPSPLFWNQLSARIGDRVATEGNRPAAWLDAAAWRRVLMPAWAAAVAAIIVVVALAPRLMAPDPRPAADASGSVVVAAPPASAAANASTDVLGDAPSDDASLMLVASLTSAMDLDAAADAGLAPDGSAEHALTHMPAVELRELERLLKAELAGS